MRRLIPLLVLALVASLPAQTTTITTGSITWTLTGTQTWGRYITGDAWVLDPGGGVTVTAISPAPAASPYRNGSMVNVRAVGSSGNCQGCDDRIGTTAFTSTLYRAPPITLVATDVLVSTKSSATNSNPEVYQGNTSIAWLEDAAILTCVAAAPAPDAFRPPYAGPPASRPQWTYSQLNLALLPSLAPTPLMGSAVPAPLAATWSGPWIDFCEGWQGRQLHPWRRMPDYGRDMSEAVGEAALFCCTNFTQTQKDKVLIGLVQFGIDTWALAQDGHRWYASGGHNIGRKLGVVVAGLLLGDAAMRDDPAGSWAEDEHTYANTGAGWIGTSSLWREITTASHDETHPMTWGSGDDSDENYRRCCTSGAWIGQALAAYVLGLTEEWAHAPFFHYVERWMAPWSPQEQSDLITYYKATALPNGGTGTALIGEAWGAWRWSHHADNVSLLGPSTIVGHRLVVASAPMLASTYEFESYNCPDPAGTLLIGFPLSTPIVVDGADVWVNPVGVVCVPFTANVYDYGTVSLTFPVGPPATLAFQAAHVVGGLLRTSDAWAVAL